MSLNESSTVSQPSIAKLGELAKNLQNELKDLIENLVKKSNEVGNLKRILGKTTLEVLGLREQITQKSRQVSWLNAANVTQRIQIKCRDTKIAKLQDENRSQEFVIKRLQGEVFAQGATIARSLDEKGDLEKQVDAVNSASGEELDKAKGKIKETEKALEEANARAASHQESFDIVRAQTYSAAQNLLSNLPQPPKPHSQSPAAQ
ncbi:MAG: hypothetical protein L6R41_004416 [Letrouitia leprolyta]|nr:MAG: hypothetical protein L6R41_004416 [Letrouitia leprolyta]